MKKYEKINLFTLELGQELIREEVTNQIFKKISNCRKEIFHTQGVVIPEIRIRSNRNLKPLEYVIKLNDIEIDRFILKKDRLMILDMGNVKTKMRGTKIREPFCFTAALYVPLKRQKEAENNGYMVINYLHVLLIHFRQTIFENLSSVINFEYVSSLMDDVSSENSSLVLALAERYTQNSFSIIKEVLIGLINENVSIRNIIPVLETIAAYKNERSFSIENLVEKCRSSIALNIVNSVAQNNELQVITFSQQLSIYLAENENMIRNGFFGRTSTGKAFIKETLEISKNFFSPVFLCPDLLRPLIYLFLKNICRLKYFTVISDTELSNALKISSQIKVYHFGEVKNVHITSSESINEIKKELIQEQEDFQKRNILNNKK